MIPEIIINTTVNTEISPHIKMLLEKIEHTITNNNTIDSYWDVIKKSEINSILESFRNKHERTTEIISKTQEIVHWFLLRVTEDNSKKTWTFFQLH